MKIRLAILAACFFGILLSHSIGADGPLLFDGPPMASEPTKVELSAFQQRGELALQIDALPPTPVPVPSDPFAVKEQPAKPDTISPPETTPVQVPVPETPAEAPEEEESVTEYAPILNAPTPPEAPHLAPPIAVEPPESTEPNPVEMIEPLPAISSIMRAAPNGYYYDDEPGVSCQYSPAPPLGFSMPCLSYSDVSLPTIPQPYVFDEFGVELGGWLDVGFTAAGTSPHDRFNGPVTFNDRHAEAQMNQLWFYLERKPNAWSCSLDLGGRIDVMYGTDAQFIQASDGLESNWEQSERFYEMALPQFYLDATLRGWTVRMGRFFTILGYESPAAPDNFFYSHAYTMQYGEPFTHTGMLVSRRFGEWLVNAGFHRGNDQFDDTDGLNALNFLGGFGYKAPGGWATFEYALSSTENGHDVTSYTHSMVNTIHITDDLGYVLQGDYGEVWNDRLSRKAAWWGLNQYFTYTINPCWAAAVRVEWFRDRHGARVSGIRAGNQTPSGLAGDFYEITLGLNWLPRTNLRVRPEVRWDIFDPRPTTTNKAFDAGNLNRQFTFGCDVVYTF